AKIPYYVIVDHGEGPKRRGVEVIGFQAGAAGYERIAPDPLRGIWIPTVALWFRPEGNRVRCLTPDGEPIPDSTELANRIREILQLKAESDARAEREQKKAEREKKKAEREKARADAAEARIRELEAELKKSKRRKK